MVRLIVAGGRKFNRYRLLKTKTLNFARLLALKNRVPLSEIEIVSGEADGADKLGERFADEFNLRVHRFPANWTKFGNGAGHIRNGEMAKFSDACITFWDGKSNGTASMIKLARKHGLELKIIYY